MMTIIHKRLKGDEKMLKNRYVNIMEMKCECGISVKYDNNCSVSFVDAWRAKEELCECEKNEV